MVFAGVLDWLNEGGAAWLGIFLIGSLVYLGYKTKDEYQRCGAKHPRFGRCRLSYTHRPRRRHTNWKGQTWWD